MPALGGGILFKGERLDYQAEYFVQHLPVWLPLLVQQLVKNIPVVDWTPQESEHYNGVRSAHLADLR